MIFAPSQHPQIPLFPGYLNVAPEVKEQATEPFVGGDAEEQVPRLPLWPLRRASVQCLHDILSVGSPRVDTNIATTPCGTTTALYRPLSKS